MHNQTWGYLATLYSLYKFIKLSLKPLTPSRSFQRLNLLILPLSTSIGMDCCTLPFRDSELWSIDMTLASFSLNLGEIQLVNSFHTIYGQVLVTGRLKSAHNFAYEIIGTDVFMAILRVEFYDKETMCMLVADLNTKR